MTKPMNYCVGTAQNSRSCLQLPRQVAANVDDRVFDCVRIPVWRWVALRVRSSVRDQAR